MRMRARAGRRTDGVEAARPIPGPAGDALRALVQRFIREVGLLSGDRTPCGKPLAVSHAHALMVLLEHRRAGRRPTQQELGRVLRIDKSNVARLCRKMERAGQLRQEHGVEDGRMRLLVLTDRGARLAASVEQASRERFQRLIDAVSPREGETVLAGLALLNDALTASARAGGAPPARGRQAPAA